MAQLNLEPFLLIDLAIFGTHCYRYIDNIFLILTRRHRHRKTGIAITINPVVLANHRRRFGFHIKIKCQPSRRYRTYHHHIDVRYRRISFSATVLLRLEFNNRFQNQLDIIQKVTVGGRTSSTLKTNNGIPGRIVVGKRATVVRPASLPPRCHLLRLHRITGPRKTVQDCTATGSTSLCTNHILIANTKNHRVRTCVSAIVTETPLYLLPLNQTDILSEFG